MGPNIIGVLHIQHTNCEVLLVLLRSTTQTSTTHLGSHRDHVTVSVPFILQVNTTLKYRTVTIVVLRCLLINDSVSRDEQSDKPKMSSTGLPPINYYFLLQLSLVNLFLLRCDLSRVLEARVIID